MKKSLFLGSTLGLLLLAGTASAEKVKYKATLNGEQQNPPVTTTASGSADLEFDTETKTLNGTITFEGITPTLGHIHEAACGEDGPVRFDFESLTSPIVIEDVTLDDEETAALEGGKYYINLHTDANPNGELRGQLLREDSDEKCPPEGGGGGGGGDGGGGGNGDGSGGGNGGGGGGGDGGASSSSSSGAAPASTDSGCSTTASAPGSGLAIALGIGMAVAAMKRGRRKR